MEANTEHQAVSDLTPMLLNAIVQEFEGRVKQLWGFSYHNPQADFAQLEEVAQQLSKECFARALQAAAQAHRHSIEEGWLLGQRRCECGESTRYKGKQARTLQTWVGPIRLERGYFYCRGCGTGCYPLDESLQIPPRSHFSDGVQQGVCLLGVQLPFERASHALEALTGICVSPKEAERITEERGQLLDEGLQAEDQLLLLGEVATGSNSVEVSGSNFKGSVWAVALDAARVRYDDGWHDTKAGVVFQAEPKLGERGEIAGAQAVRGSSSYVGETASMERAGERLGAEAARRGIGSDERVVCLGDGAPCNWTQFDMHFSNRVEVLDWYHAVEHLWQAGNGMYGQGTGEAVRWVKAREGELWEGKVEKVIAALHKGGEREGSQGAEGEAARSEIHYFETNTERMRYNQYRAAGYPIGSGIVESACKQLIGARLKGAGMCWGKGKRGAQGVLTLRAELLSGRWVQSWPKTRPQKLA